MAKAKKLKSGNWRVQVFDCKDEQGKRHYRSFTAETKTKAEYLAAKFADEKAEAGPDWKKPQAMTVRQAVEKYIELSASLSPTTISNYEHILKYAFSDIMDLPVKKLNKETLQVAVNKEAKRKSTTSGKILSAKTVRNEYGLISSALSEVCEIHYDLKLPVKQRKVKEYPEPGEVLKAIVGSSVELPCMLAMWLSFSLSEIRGLMCSSVRKGCIYIDQVKVNVDGLDIVKENAKVETRLRKHQIPDYIMDLIKQEESYKRFKATGKDEPLISINGNQIQGRWKRVCTKAGFKLTFHDLRHMNASIMMLLNIPEKYAMERGGWSTPHVMKSVYQHTFSDERKAVDDTVNNYFSRLLKEEAEEDSV